MSLGANTSGPDNVIASHSRFVLNSRNARAIAWLLLFVGMLFCRGGFLEDVIYNIDEAEYAVAADALDHGWLPGVDLLGSTKPPGIVLLYDVLFHIFGRSLAVVHVAHLAIILLAGVLVAELAAALWGFAAIVPAALLFWMTSNSFSLPSEMLAMNVESPGLLFALLALWLAWTKASKGSGAMLAGVSLGVAMLFRQSFLFFGIPALYAIFSESRWKGVFRCAMGVAIPWLPILIIYAARGGLGWALDSWIRYPLTYASDLGWFGFFEAFWRNSIEFVQQEAASLLIALVGVISWWQERRSRRGKFLLLLIVASFLALTSGSRFFGHYWIQVFPAVALLGAAGWLWLVNRGKSYRRALALVVAIGSLLTLRHYPLWRQWDPWAEPEGFSHYSLGRGEAEKALGQFAAANTSPDETIVVWGYCPQIYYYAHRLPGVRDYLCHYTTGFSPATFSPLVERAIRPYGHPRAQEMFAADLKARRPKFILDIAPIREYEFPFFQYPLRTYPLIADYVRANYHPEQSVAGALIYRRNDSDEGQAPQHIDKSLEP